MAGGIPYSHCLTCGHSLDYNKVPDATPLCNCSCHNDATPRVLNTSELRRVLTEYDHLRTFRDTLQAENSRVTEENRKLTQYLNEIKDLCLLFLGQHLWAVLLPCPGPGRTTCLCAICDRARHTYEMISGSRPTREQELEWMHKFAKGGL